MAENNARQHWWLKDKYDADGSAYQAWMAVWNEVFFHRSYFQTQVDSACSKTHFVHLLERTPCTPWTMRLASLRLVLIQCRRHTKGTSGLAAAPSSHTYAAKEIVACCLSPELCSCWQGKNFLVAHPHTQDLPASGKLMQHALYNTCTALRGGVLLGHEQVRAWRDLKTQVPFKNQTLICQGC